MNIIEQYRAHIFEFTSLKCYANPFLDVVIKATFYGPDKTIIEREAYWDGDNSYKVQFAPTVTGHWTYLIEAPEETGLNRMCGEIECVPYSGSLDIYKHGFLKVASNKRYLTYGDGTPFFWLGDTHWEFAYRELWDTSNHPDMSSMFKGMVDRRVAQGYNVYQTNLRSENLLIDGFEQLGELNYWTSYEEDIPNVDFYKNELDRRFAYVANAGLVNALGIAWGGMMGKGEKYLNRQLHLARYIVARYGAYPLVYTLAGEVAGYDPNQREINIDGWGKVMEEIVQKDGYHHLKTAHYTNDRPFATYYQEEDWMDFTLNQAGHGDAPISINDYREYIRKYPKPFIEGEAMYEFVSTLEEMGTRLCTPDLIRRVCYNVIQCGGCGYTYGAQGIWDCVYEKGLINPFNKFNRFDIPWTTAIDGEGGKQMGYMKQFYEREKFWEMEPHSEDGEFSDHGTLLENGNLDQQMGIRLPNVTRNADRTRWILYYNLMCRRSFTIHGLNNATYRMEWFNPRTNCYEFTDETITITDGSFKTPARPDADDWLLVLRQI